MADQTDIEMRKKYLHYVKPSTDMIDVAIREFEVALDNRDGLDKDELNKKVFLPYMCDLKGSKDESKEVGRIHVGEDNSTERVEDNSTERVKVYKVNAPGFFYYQHYKGKWDPSGYIRILVCRSSNFKDTPVFELLNTNGNGNDHVNNMFPIRPGSSTYIMVIGSFCDKSDKKQLFFAPHWKPAKGDSDAITSVGEVYPPSAINDGTPNSEAFKDCFR